MNTHEAGKIALENIKRLQWEALVQKYWDAASDEVKREASLIWWEKHRKEVEWSIKLSI
jgi:hypothetical protein